MITIDLEGSDGNVYFIAGRARTWSKQLHPKAKTQSILDETTEYLGHEGEYKDVLDTFDRRFKGKVGYEFLNDPRED